VAAIISVNNTIYVAGGFVNGVLSNKSLETGILNVSLLNIRMMKPVLKTSPH
jgi:hypothetical protein